MMFRMALAGFLHFPTRGGLKRFRGLTQLSTTANALPSGPPRVAIVGGGLAGSLCALVLRSRGAVPVVFDAGRRTLGGRIAGGLHPDSGLQVVLQCICLFGDDLLS